MVVFVVVGVAAGVVAVGGSFFGVRYKVCEADEVLVKTGMGLGNDIHIMKSGMKYPFQTARKVKLEPVPYNFALHNMSKEKVEFKLPISFTIGPYDPEEHLDLFKNYIKYAEHLDPTILRNTILGIIEGETRGVTAALHVEDMFNDKESFRTSVLSHVQPELDKIGLKIYNANIQEMTDYDEANKYFAYRKQRAIETANYEAQVAVAQAQKDGNIGIESNKRDEVVALAQIEQEMKVAECTRGKETQITLAELERERQIAQQEQTNLAEISLARLSQEQIVAKQEQETQAHIALAKLEQDKVIAENKRSQEIAVSNAELAETRAESTRRKQMADITATMEAQKMEVDMQREVQELRKVQQIEARRAETLSESIVNAEKEVKEAEGRSQAMRLLADANLYQKQKEAEALMMMKTKEAEGVRAMYEAQAEGLERLIQSSGNDSDLTRFNMALNANLFPIIAEKNAKAVQGLNPKITIWNTGSDAEKNNDVTAPFLNLMRNFTPALNTLKDDNYLGFMSGNRGQETSDPHTMVRSLESEQGVKVDE